MRRRLLQELPYHDYPLATIASSPRRISLSRSAASPRPIVFAGDSVRIENARSSASEMRTSSLLRRRDCDRKRETVASSPSPSVEIASGRYGAAGAAQGNGSAAGRAPGTAGPSATGHNR